MESNPQRGVTMKSKLFRARFIFALIIISLLIISSLAGCEPMFKIKVENQTDQELTVYINDRFIGQVIPSETIEGETMLTRETITFTAKNNEGEIVFKKIYSTKEIHQNFKVIIK